MMGKLPIIHALMHENCLNLPIYIVFLKCFQNENKQINKYRNSFKIKKDSCHKRIWVISNAPIECYVYYLEFFSLNMEFDYTNIHSKKKCSQSLPNVISNMVLIITQNM